MILLKHCKKGSNDANLQCGLGVQERSGLQPRLHLQALQHCIHCIYCRMWLGQRSDLWPMPHLTTLAWPCCTLGQNSWISVRQACFRGYLKSMSSAIFTSWSNRDAWHCLDRLLRESCRQRMTRAEPCMPKPDKQLMCLQGISIAQQIGARHPSLAASAHIRLLHRLQTLRTWWLKSGQHQSSSLCSKAWLSGDQHSTAA